MMITGNLGLFEDFPQFAIPPVERMQFGIITVGGRLISSNLPRFAQIRCGCAKNLSQIKNYERECPNLLKFCEFGQINNSAQIKIPLFSDKTLNCNVPGTVRTSTTSATEDTIGKVLTEVWLPHLAQEKTPAEDVLDAVRESRNEYFLQD
jgi:hypothetical protein